MQVGYRHKSRFWCNSWLSKIAGRANYKVTKNSWRGPCSVGLDRTVGDAPANVCLSRLYFSHFATCTVDYTVDPYAAKPDIENHVFYLPHLHSTPPLGGILSEYCHPVWCGKTRMAWLPEGEKISKIRLFVLTWSTNVTDRGTVTQALVSRGDWGNQLKGRLSVRGAKHHTETLLIKLYKYYIRHSTR